jgi:glycosyltransferase involved in cell wall biosynthesis
MLKREPVRRVIPGYEKMNQKGASNKKILILSYPFPPTAYVGVHRTLKYCKYLGRHGWTPIVLTAKPIGVTFQDENLLRQLPPEVEVYRTLDFDPAKWEDKLAKRKRWRAQVAGANVPAEAGPVVSESASGASGPGVLSRLKQLIKGLLKDSPDSHVFWVPFALLRGVAILLRKKVDIIYSTSPPHSTHLAAYLLARCFCKPYVLDFREPWYVNGSKRSPSGKNLTLFRLETRAKRAIVRRAARIICMSRGECEDLRAEFPEVDAERISYIPNGFDPTDFAETGAVVDRLPQLTLIHSGTVYAGIAGEFFQALGRLVETYPATAQSMQVQLLGEIAGEYDDAVSALENAGIVKVFGLQPYAKTLQMVQGSDVLVILMGGSKYLPSHLPSKLFEYLHAGKPIFAIAPEGEVTEILKRSGLGLVVRPHSVDSVEEALRNLMADHAAGLLKTVPNQSYIRSFERAALTERLARVLDAVKEAELVRQ